MSNLNLGDTVELYNLEKRLDLNGRLGVICKLSDGKRYGIKIDGSMKGILVKLENIREITSNLKINIDKIEDTNKDNLIPTVLPGLLDGRTMKSVCPALKDENLDNEIVKNRNSSNIFWCLHPDCLESTEYFNSQEELDEHMKLHLE